MMDEDMPMIVMTVSLALIILGVGTFAFFVTTSEVGYETTQTEEFSVANPKVDQKCELDYSVDKIDYVEQYNGYAWQTVASSHYSLSGQTVTVQASGLQG